MRAEAALTGVWGDLYSITGHSSGSGSGSSKDKPEKLAVENKADDGVVVKKTRRATAAPTGSIDKEEAKQQLRRQAALDKADQAILLVNQAKKSLASESGLFAYKSQQLKDMTDKVQKCLKVENLPYYSHDWDATQPPTHGVTVMRSLQAAEKALTHLRVMIRGNLDEPVEPSSLLSSLRALSCMGWPIHWKAFECVIKTAVFHAARDFNWAEVCAILADEQPLETTETETEREISMRCFTDAMRSNLLAANVEEATAAMAIQRAVKCLIESEVVSVLDALIGKECPSELNWVRCHDLCGLMLAAPFGNSLGVKSQLENIQTLCSVATGKLSARAVGAAALKAAIEAVKSSTEFWKLFNTNRGGLALLAANDSVLTQMDTDALCKSELDALSKAVQTLSETPMDINLFWKSGGEVTLHAQSTVCGLQVKKTSITDKASSEFLNIAAFQAVDTYLSQYMDTLQSAAKAKFVDDIAGPVSVNLEVACNGKEKLRRMEAVKKLECSLASFLSLDTKTQHQFIQSKVNIERIAGKDNAEKFTAVMANTRTIMAKLGSLLPAIRYDIDNDSLGFDDFVFKAIQSLGVDGCTVKTFLEGTNFAKSMTDCISWFLRLLALRQMDVLLKNGYSKPLKAFLSSSISDLIKCSKELEVEVKPNVSALKLQSLFTVFSKLGAGAETYVTSKVLTDASKDAPAADALDVTAFCVMLPGIVSVAKVISSVSAAEKAQKMQSAMTKLLDKKLKEAEQKKTLTTRRLTRRSRLRRLCTSSRTLSPLLVHSMMWYPASRST